MPNFITFWKALGIYPLLTWFQSSTMMRSTIILSLLRATLHEDDILESLWKRQTANELIQDADDHEEGLRHSLQPRMSEEQTAIFATIYCWGPVL